MHDVDVEAKKRVLEAIMKMAADGSLDEIKKKLQPGEAVGIEMKKEDPEAMEGSPEEESSEPPAEAKAEGDDMPPKPGMEAPADDDDDLPAFVKAMRKGK